MKPELSKNTITLLILLVVLVSVIGMLSFVSDQAPEEELNNQGSVSLEIEPPKATGRAMTSSGNVQLEIIPPEG